MKKIFLSLFILAISVGVYAQSAASPHATDKQSSERKPIHAEFKYNADGFQKAIAANNIVLYLRDLPNGPALEGFDRTLGYYKDLYVMVVGKLNPNGERECIISFKNPTATTPKVLMRLFVANGMNELVFDNKKVGTEEFFSRY